MPTFIMLTSLTPEGAKTLKNNPSRVAEVNREVEALGAKVLSQYATLGQFDFVTVIEAESEEAMVRVSAEMGSRGTMSSETMGAVPTDRLDEIL